MELINPQKDEVFLVSIAEFYHKTNILNMLRVDFDFNILEEANRSILKGTYGNSSPSSQRVFEIDWLIEQQTTTKKLQ